jgi:hypothetical protein
MLVKKERKAFSNHIRKQQKYVDEKSFPTKDYDGHPFIGYMDGDVFVPNNETVDALRERSRMLSEYRSELGD